MPDEDLMKLW